MRILVILTLLIPTLAYSSCPDTEFVVNKLNQLPNSRLLSESYLLATTSDTISREIKQIISVTEGIDKDILLVSIYVQEIEKKLSCDEISDIGSFISEKRFVDLWLGMTEAMYLLSKPGSEFNKSTGARITEEIGDWNKNVDAATITGFVSIITTKSNVPVGEKLVVNNENVVIRMAAETYVPLSALKPDSYDSIKGRHIIGPFKAGSILVSSDLEKEAD